ncbi:uncharacterized protein FOMMEDRAFT_161639 [Fomitiporia mediterranea MF3/22]|uniref:uncharacterized protein n=1 Tax=Fomitiporia mediterranea (strain MF3/22) TaxID=694068 RepID=UPI0004407392|nr:uncharacterized protein FOMMEDRAFT_161639 [Fomitiporia mediterranea MF3/22]EJC98802.1 hypothetical protein FOMMEDRAFT_161639 [Fomitiporia mediterranea MF3/22]
MSKPLPVSSVNVQAADFVLRYYAYLTKLTYIPQADGLLSQELATPRKLKVGRPFGMRPFLSCGNHDVYALHSERPRPNKTVPKLYELTLLSILRPFYIIGVEWVKKNALQASSSVEKGQNLAKSLILPYRSGVVLNSSNPCYQKFCGSIYVPAGQAILGGVPMAMLIISLLYTSLCHQIQCLAISMSSSEGFDARTASTDTYSLR